MDMFGLKEKCVEKELTEVSSPARKKKNGEFFTPSFMVKEILEKLPAECWSPDKTFCDPACGSGNMLVEVFIKKRQNGSPSLQALKTTYGVELMMDNVLVARQRLLDEVVASGEVITEEMKKIVERNIVCRNSLEFNFEF